MAVFLDVEPCALVDTDRRFTGAYGAVALMMEAVSTSEASVNIYQTTRRNNQEDSHLRTRRHQNLKSHRPNLTAEWLSLMLRTLKVSGLT
jgi:hypothetical protein